MEAASAFCENLRALRESLDISADEFGKKLGITAKHIYDIEKGRKKPSFDLIVSISNVFNISISDLFKSQIDVKPALTMGKFAKRIANVPESVWEFIEKVSVDDKTAWQDVEAVLESAIERREAKKSNNKRA